MGKFARQGPAVVVVSSDDLQDLRTFEDSARTGVLFAVASDTALRQRFDRSAIAAEREQFRVEWVPPVYLVIDAGGRVVARAGGPGFSAWLSPVMDSLLTAPR